MRGKKAVEMRYIVLAIIFLVAIFAWFAIFSGLAGGAGKQTAITIGGVNYATPNVYETLFGLGITFGACEQLGLTGAVGLQVGENDVCWSPTAPRYSTESSPTFFCPELSHVQKVIYDLDKSKDVTFYIKERDTGSGSDLITPISGAVTKDNVEADIQSKGEYRGIGFIANTADKTVKFSDNKIVVNKITCSEVRSVDLEPLLGFDRTFIDFKTGEQAEIIPKYINHGDPDATCDGAKIYLYYKKWNTNDAWGLFETLDLPETCGPAFENFPPVYFTPQEAGMYSFLATISGVPDESDEAQKNNDVENTAPVVSYNYKYEGYAEPQSSYASDIGTFWSARYSTTYNVPACYIVPDNRDNKYIIAPGPYAVEINGKDTSSIALAVSQFPDDGYASRVSMLPPETRVREEKYFLMEPSFMYYIRPGVNPSSGAAVCGWFLDPNNKANDNDDSHIGNTLTIYALNDQPTYECKPSRNTDPEISLSSGENTVCWYVTGKHKGLKSADFKCPPGKTVQKAKMSYFVEKPADKLYIRNSATQAVVKDLTADLGQTYGGEVDISNAGANKISFQSITKDGVERKLDDIRAHAIFCS